LRRACEAAPGEPTNRARPAAIQGFTWSTLKKLEPRGSALIAKAEWTRGEDNPALQIVTTLTIGDGRHLYEDIYCHTRCEMENNRIKECQIDLFADRTSTSTMRRNQLACGFLNYGLCRWSNAPVAWPAATDLGLATCGYSIPASCFKSGASSPSRFVGQVRHGVPGLSLQGRLRTHIAPSYRLTERDRLADNANPDTRRCLAPRLHNQPCNLEPKTRPRE